jgi:hypothetical protein
VSAADLGEGLLVRLLTSLCDESDHAVGAGLVEYRLDEPAVLVCAVGAAQQWDAWQLGVDAGPIVEAGRTEKPFVADPFDPDDLPGATSRAQPSDPPPAVVAIPGPWTDSARLVTTLYLARSPSQEDLDVVGRYDPLLAYAHGLVEYCGQAETQATQLLRMVEYRHVIEQAKGMVMTRRGVSPDEAFALLVASSQQHNVKLRALSVALVESVGGGPVEHPEAVGQPETVPTQARTAARELWGELGGEQR